MNITEIMEAKGTPTLKAIAAVFDIPTQRIYSVAKQPKEGEVYDAKVYNWDAITRFIERRLDADARERRKGKQQAEDTAHHIISGKIKAQLPTETIHRMALQRERRRLQPIGRNPAGRREPLGEIRLIEPHPLGKAAPPRKQTLQYELRIRKHLIRTAPLEARRRQKHAVARP